MKKLIKALSLTMAVVLLCLSLTACGEKAPSLSKVFTGGAASYIDGIGWYNSDVYTLKLNSDNTYELTYQQYRFGTTDPGSKGLRTVIYTGKCSVGASADGWETHQDITLEPAEHIYFEQHEKGYGRSAIPGHCVVDTNNWTAAMTELLDPENNALDAKAFLAEYAETLTITVEDPALDAEDPSLGYRIITLPELKLVAAAG